MPRFIAITDYDGHEIHVDAARVVSVRTASGLVHDHGSVTLDTGATISFQSDSGPLRLLRELERLHQADAGGVGWGDKREKTD